MQSIIEHLREQAINQLFKGKSFTACWPTWGVQVRQLVGTSPTVNGIIDLGDSLSAVFRSTAGAGGRSQASLSGGGAGWESLICWYLNLCLIGTRTVVIKEHKALVPDPISKAITVNYGNSPSNTEADLLAITFPDDPIFSTDISQIRVQGQNGQQIPTTKRGKFNYKEIIDQLVNNQFNNHEVGIIQCKTNWNDNAQIPMLWDMVYSATSFINAQVSIGQGGFSIRNLRKFTYSFATVPTSRVTNISPNKLLVLRVRNLSGGNYWGKPSITGVAASIKEIFNKNFPNINIRTSLQANIPSLPTDFAYFRLP